MLPNIAVSPRVHSKNGAASAEVLPSSGEEKPFTIQSTILLTGWRTSLASQILARPTSIVRRDVENQTGRSVGSPRVAHCSDSPQRHLRRMPRLAWNWGDDEMRTFFAISGRRVFNGGYIDCLLWANSVVTRNHTRIAKVLIARPGEKVARVVAEITQDGLRIIQRPVGRVVGLRTLRRASNGR